MNEYNIEFGHIYADKKFGKEQEKSIDVLKKTISSLKGSFITCILIDELSPEVVSLDEKSYIKIVKSYGVPVDIVASESKLAPVAEALLAEIPESNIKKERFDSREVILLLNGNQKIGLMEKSGRYSCSLLIAAWVLCRAGIFELPPDAATVKSKSLEAKHLITILPEKYRKTEDKVLEILKATKYKDVVGRIKYKFF